MHDQIISLIRTYVPVAVGAFLTFLAVELGVVVDEHVTTGLTTGLVGLVSALYYAVARALEQRWPWLGWLLGVPKQPTYREGDKV